ncbi:MAG: hypothetical protein ACYSTS_07775 [Planctomycetota bacterium]|jgi:hypothetical protein
MKKKNRKREDVREPNHTIDLRKGETPKHYVTRIKNTDPGELAECVKKRVIARYIIVDMEKHGRLQWGGTHYRWIDLRDNQTYLIDKKGDHAFTLFLKKTYGLDRTATYTPFVVEELMAETELNGDNRYTWSVSDIVSLTPIKDGFRICKDCGGIEEVDCSCHWDEDDYEDEEDD